MGDTLSIIIWLLFFGGILYIYHFFSKETWKKNDTECLRDERDEYSKLLQDERWKEKRRKIISRDRCRCTWCGSDSNLQVHHKYYEKFPNNEFVDLWDYPDETLVTLCEKCHEKAHEKYRTRVYHRRFGKHYE